MLYRLKVEFANIVGLLSAKIEFNDYQKENEPDVLCLVEKKLKNI